MTTRRRQKTIAAGVGACVLAASVPAAAAAQSLGVATGSLAPLTAALPVILSSRADLLVASETDDYPIVLLLRRER